MCNVLLNAVIHSASLATVRSLIREEKIQISAAFKDLSDEITPLSAAAARCNVEIVALLLEAGADPNGPLKKTSISCHIRYR